MKKFALVLAACAATPVFAGTDIGVSIGINQPGVYGRIDIGNYRQPAVVYPEPVVVAPSPVAIHQRPIYLYVPPEHQRDWSRHCVRYNACGQPVYFVREDWVQDRYHQEHEHDRDRAHRGHDRDGERGDHDRHERRDEDRRGDHARD